MWPRNWSKFQLCVVSAVSSRFRIAQELFSKWVNRGWRPPRRGIMQAFFHLGFADCSLFVDFFFFFFCNLSFPEAVWLAEWPESSTDVHWWPLALFQSLYCMQFCFFQTPTHLFLFLFFCLVHFIVYMFAWFSTYSCLKSTVPASRLCLLPLMIKYPAFQDWIC